MCMHIFAPGCKIQLDYAAESIELSRGGSEDLLDLLLTNHSLDPINHIHVVYPHAIPSKQVAGEPTPSFCDLSETWLEENSPYNRFYQTQETQLQIKHSVGCYEIVVTMPDPQDITKTLDYKGYIKGTQHLTPYQVSGKELLTDIQWDILSKLGWSVFTLHFEQPIPPKEPRWLRLQGRNGLLFQNRSSFWEQMWLKYTGQLIHSFEIAGPIDVRHRIISGLKAAGVIVGSGPAREFSKLELSSLQDKLLIRGLDSLYTQTVVKDWRINIFSQCYHRLDEPTFWGDIRPCGGLSNPIKARDGTTETCLQWKAGESNINPQANRGLFGARIRAHDVPWIVPTLPWIAISLVVTLNFTKIKTSVITLVEFVKRLFA